MAVELTEKYWKKNKAMTLKDNGLAGKLKEFEAAFATLEKASKNEGMGQLETAYDEAQECLKEVKRLATELKEKANKTLHKDSIKLLETYLKETIPAAANDVMKLHANTKDAFDAQIKMLETDLKKALKYINEQDKAVGQALDDAAELVDTAKELSKAAIAAAAKNDKKKLTLIDKQVSDCSLKFIGLRNGLNNHIKQVRTNFYNMLPKKRSGKIPEKSNLAKDIDRVDTIFMKVDSDVGRLVDMEGPMESALDIVQDALKGNVDAEKAYEKIVTADLQRLSGLLGPVGGAGTSVDTNIKQARAFMEQAEKLDEGEERTSLLARTDVVLKNVALEMPRWVKLINEVKKRYEQIRKDYPDFVNKDNQNFKDAVADLDDIGNMIEENREMAKELFTKFTKAQSDYKVLKG